MSAFRRGKSPVVYIGPLRAGAVDVPRTSTKQESLEVGRRIEVALSELALTGWADLVERVALRTLDLMELYTAKIEGAVALQEIRLRAKDRPLKELIAEHRENVTDTRAKAGLDQLEALAPADARLSWIRDPRNLTQLYRRAVAGEDREDARRSPNSVRRSLHRAVSDLLSHVVGRGQMLAIMDEVKIPAEHDTRSVMLSADEILAALAAADEEFRPVVGYAICTMIDRRPLLEQRAHHYDEATGQLSVPDRKTKGRARTLALRGEPVLGNAEFWLRQLVAGKGPQEPLVSLTQQQIRTRWAALRKTIKRPDIRWKDLRGIGATYYLLAGGDVRELQHIMGHTSGAMTLRYLRLVPAGNKAGLKEMARGVTLPGRRGLQLEKEA